MRLSRHTHYALRVVLDLTGHPRDRSADIARRQGIPPAYMAKVVNGLSKAGILRTHRGTHGGVQLARPPESVTLRDVLEAAEGPLAINLCVVWGDCPCPQPCPVRASLAHVQQLLERDLDGTTIAELAAHLPQDWPGLPHVVER